MLVRTAATGAGIALTFICFASSGQQAAPWVVRGEAIVTCPCKVPCPCRSNARPSQSHCENLSYVRVMEGNYGPTKLNGVEYVWAADECTGRAHPRRPTNLYLPKTVTSAQIAAIETIMTGEHCARLGATEMRTKRVSLAAAASGSFYSIRVPGILRMEVDLAPGIAPMEPLPALDSWSNTVTYARNIAASIDDPQAGLKWDYSGLQANYRTFEATSRLQQQGKMLAMFRDDAGTFNEVHRSLIRELHLQIPLSRDEFDRMLAQVRVPATATSGAPAGGSYLSGAVAGTVYGTNSEARSGARIRFNQSSPAPIPVAVSNAAGRYFIARVPEGHFEMCAFSWDGQSAQKACALVSVKPGAVLRQDLKLSALSGT